MRPAFSSARWREISSRYKQGQWKRSASQSIASVFNRVGLNVGDAVPAAQVTPEGLQARVAALLARG